MNKATFTLLSLLLVSSLQAQNGSIQLIPGPDEIAENQAWTLTIFVNNDQLKSYENFPDIDGFRKRGTSSSSQTNINNGQISSSQSLIMTYAPLKQGIVNIPAISLKVNNQVVSLKARKVKVGPPAQVQQQSDPFKSFFNQNPLDDFFGRSGDTEFIDVKEDALFALTTSKEEVYVGEGFTAALSFLVADNNQAPMQFHELGPQLSEILKKLKPANCWEENFNIENVEGEPIKINGKGYLQFKIYQAAFFPLNNQPVIFPSVGLKMIKYKVAKNPSFFGQSRQEDFKTFYTKPKTIRIKELPPHPLRDAVAVGNYQLQEKLSTTEMETGQSVSYDFNILGEGNLSSVEKPVITRDSNFDIYEPNVKQNITRENGHVAGGKSFNYFLIPKEPGKFNLGDHFKWIYFNLAKKKYDTLRSAYVVNVIGESQKNQAIESSDPGSFYDRSALADNQLHTISSGGWMKLAVNLFILLIIGGAIYLIFKK